MAELPRPGPVLSRPSMPGGPVRRQAALFPGAVSGGVTGPLWPAACSSDPGQTGVMARERQRDDSGTELGRFLYARRTQITPAEVGFTPGAGRRRIPGLRREEVAALAGVSIDYYTRLERGKETRPSPAVADALARALKLDPDEHEHLRALAARAARYAPEPAGTPSRTVRPQLKLLLETLRPTPACITSRTLDLLAANPGGLGLYAGLGDWPAAQRNIARFLFLHPAAREVYGDWDYQIRGCVARLRALARPAPPRRPMPPKKTFHHPQVGTVTLGFQGMQLEDTPGQRLTVYLAEPGTPDYDAMVLLDLTAPQQAGAPAAEPRR